jgi:pyruvate dehydrogenase E2 component (dihydrolipoamide acetyltransferase)
MPHQMKFQDPGEGIHEGEIVEVLVSEGDTVSEGEDVLVVETDKATTSLPASHSGRIAEIKVGEGDQIEVGDVLLVLDEAEDEPEQRRGGKSFAVGELPEYETSDKAEEQEQEQDEEEPKKPTQPKRSAERPVPASPATRRLARELDVDIRDVEPSGPHERVTDDDVRAAAESGKAKPQRSRSEHPDESQADEPKADEKRSRRSTQRQTGPERPELPDFAQFGKIERVPLRSVRRATAKRTTLSWQQIPHVWHHDLADITELERWRRDRSPALAKDNQRISLMVLVMKAVAGLLQRYPRFNASLDTEQSELVLKHHCPLGVAVDTERGLVVGVVRDVDRTPLVELAETTKRMIERVRNRDVKPDELRGATFTLTNVGPLGGTSFEPLVNFPQAAILGMAQARLQQVVTGDLDDPQTDIRYLLPLSLAYDHRVNDGADAARFIRDLGNSLRNADSLLMNT